VRSFAQYDLKILELVVVPVLMVLVLVVMPVVVTLAVSNY
jgi:hypothetical protein